MQKSESQETDTITLKKLDNIAPKKEETPKPIVEEVVKAKDSSLTETIPAINDTVIFTHSIWAELLTKYVSDKGIVNYKGFKQDKKSLKKYLDQLSNNLPDQDWNKSKKLAYWMNAYNAFTVKLIIDHYPVQSIKDIKDPWDARFFKLGKKWYNLNEIEHKILRKMGEPKIHFGINCASYSCPKLSNKAFTEQNVNKELQKLAIHFINDPNKNTITPTKVQLSKIFSWFGKDFKTEGTLIDSLNQYSEIKIKPNAIKNFKKYNWNLNE
ncbi:DUF547 domain-containing protein [Aquimarina algicola]|uniref:DUF547 domain-containing protein n=1 Tax=Aquimarina algicola TaxID=2589995 RepID=A0A504JI41_9FLAO|nr:DUF547 domain-containing protein [Aquimarina algicola]